MPTLRGVYAAADESFVELYGPQLDMARQLYREQRDMGLPDDEAIKALSDAEIDPLHDEGRERVTRCVTEYVHARNREPLN